MRKVRHDGHIWILWVLDCWWTKPQTDLLQATLSGLFDNCPAFTDQIMNKTHVTLIKLSVSLFQDYPFHLASAVCEWIAAFSFICFFLTYIDDFKVSIKPPNATVFFKFCTRRGSYFCPFFFSYSCLPYEWIQNTSISRCSLQIVNDFCMNISIFKIKDVPQLFLNDECSYILFFYYFILQRFDKTFVSHDWNR